MRNKPLTRTERKILVYNKMKRGLSYEEAYNEVEGELSRLDKMNNDKRIKSRKKENERGRIISTRTDEKGKKEI